MTDDAAAEMLICLKPAWEERKKKAADIYRTNGILFPHYELEVRETIFYEKGLTIPHTNLVGRLELHEHPRY